LAQPPGGAERRLVAVPTIRANNDTQEGIATHNLSAVCQLSDLRELCKIVQQHGDEGLLRSGQGDTETSAGSHTCGSGGLAVNLVTDNVAHGANASRALLHVRLLAANARREARTQALNKLQPISDLSGSHCAC
jgi:hypothetical protein